MHVPIPGPDRERGKGGQEIELEMTRKRPSNTSERGRFIRMYALGKEEREAMSGGWTRLRSPIGGSRENHT